MLTYLTGENDLFLPLAFLFISGVLGLLCACAVNAFALSDVSILKCDLFVIMRLSLGSVG